MKPVSISKPFPTRDQAMSHDHQNNRQKARNKRRQQQRWRRKRNQNLFSLEQHAHPIFPNQNLFSHEQHAHPIFPNQNLFSHEQNTHPIFLNRNLFPHEQHTHPIFPNQNHFLCRYENMFSQIVKPITVVAGSSMASRLIESNLQTSKDTVKLTFESGCNCAKMLNWLSTVEGHNFMTDASTIILILGTNDLHVVGAEKTVERIEQTVQTIRHWFPGVKIIWQLLQWRVKPTRYISIACDVLHEIHRCNIMLLDLARILQFQTIDPALTRAQICRDGLHPTRSGSRMIENCIRFFLEQ